MNLPRLGFDDAGDGEPALLMLTGWCSSRGRWDRARPLLERGRRVVSFEWRGHGESAAAEADFGIAEMVDDALAVMQARGLGTVIPCAASHSGWVAIELQRRLGPERVPAIVHLDWTVTEPPPPYMALLAQLQSPTDWPSARDALFAIWRGGSDSPEIAQAIEVMRRQDAEMWIRSGRVIEGSYRTHSCPLLALSQLPAPPRVLHLYGQPRGDEYLSAQRAFAAAHPWFEVDRLSGATHFSMIETPAEVADAIEAFAAAVPVR
ncbi:MAG: alpha/beta fold hydrolase [Solirubrobacteraceae bacterium]